MHGKVRVIGGILELVVGAFGEVSSDLGSLIKAMVESRVLFLARELGKPIPEGWSSVVISQYRRFFSVLFGKVQAACLTARLGHLGMGAREAAGRRRNLLQQEQSSRREAAAFHTAYVRGRGRK